MSRICVRTRNHRNQVATLYCRAWRVKRPACKTRSRSTGSYKVRGTSLTLLFLESSSRTLSACRLSQTFPGTAWKPRYAVRGGPNCLNGIDAWGLWRSRSSYSWVHKSLARRTPRGWSNGALGHAQSNDIEGVHQYYFPCATTVLVGWHTSWKRDYPSAGNVLRTTEAICIL